MSRSDVPQPARGDWKVNPTTEIILEALPSDRVVQSSALATVTSSCVIVRRGEQRAQTVVPIVHICDIRKIKTTVPALLVISAGSFLICAAAYCSKQGSGAVFPSAILGAFFLMAYFANRRVAVLLVTESGETATEDGSPGEASRLVKTISSLRARL